MTAPAALRRNVRPCDGGWRCRIGIPEYDGVWIHLRYRRCDVFVLNKWIDKARKRAQHRMTREWTARNIAIGIVSGSFEETP